MLAHWLKRSVDLATMTTLVAGDRFTIVGPTRNGRPGWWPGKEGGWQPRLWTGPQVPVTPSVSCQVSGLILEESFAQKKSGYAGVSWRPESSSIQAVPILMRGSMWPDTAARGPSSIQRRRGRAPREEPRQAQVREVLVQVPRHERPEAVCEARPHTL